MRGLDGDPPPRAQKSDSDSPDPGRALDELMERHPIAGRQIPAAHLKTLQDEIATYAILQGRLKKLLHSGYRQDLK